MTKNVSQLPTAAALTGGEVYLAMQSGATVKVPGSALDARFAPTSQPGGSSSTVTVKTYAATDAQRAVLGNGVAKPLSGFYSTLAAAQAAYPHATALANELDWAVIQAAINAVSTAEDGYLSLPPGIWMCNRQILLKSDVHLVGAGFRQSLIFFSASLGTNVAAIDGSAAFSQTYAPTITGIGIIGPGGQSVGNAGSNFMWGVKLGGHSKMTDCQVSGFWAGVAFPADHNILTRCKISTNYHNVLWPDGWTTTGNHQFNQCDMTGALFSCLTVQGSNLMDGCQFNGGHVGFAPYGIYKYDGAAASTKGFMSETELHGLAFEAIGNGGILDESTGAGGGSDSLFGVRISNPGFAWGDIATYKIAARPRDYAVNVRNVSVSDIFSGTYPFLPGNIATFNFAVGVTGLTIHGGGAAPPLLAGNAYGVRLVTANAEAIYYQAASGVNVGLLVEAAGALTVQQYGLNSRAFAGVALATGAANAWVPVAWRGLVFVDVGAEAVAAAGVPLVPSPGSTPRVAPAPGTGSFGHTFGGAGVPGKHPIVGYSRTSMAANTTAEMWLESPRPDRTFIAPGAVTSLPAASVGYRGQILRVEGGAGVADATYVCKKDAAGAYSWIAF